MRGFKNPLIDTFPPFDIYLFYFFYFFPFLFLGGFGRQVTILAIVLSELFLAEHSTFMEERKRNDCLGNTNALTTEDTTEPESLGVQNHLAHRGENTNGLTLDLAGLHDNLEARERIGDDDINGRDDAGGDQVGGRATEG